MDESISTLIKETHGQCARLLINCKPFVERSLDQPLLTLKTPIESSPLPFILVTACLALALVMVWCDIAFVYSVTSIAALEDSWLIMNIP